MTVINSLVSKQKTKIKLNTYRKTNEDGKVFLYKLENFPEIKKAFIENFFDFDIIGDQLGLKHEIEVIKVVFFKGLWIFILN